MRLFFAILLLSFASACLAADPHIQELIEKAVADKLYQHDYWHKLLHYKPDEDQGVASEIITPEYFLAKNGSHDPKAELLATINAYFREAAKKNTNTHARCRFVARYAWLNKRIKLDQIPTASIPCPNYEKWSKGGKISSISLIFATGYLGNPASYYGHLLLKLNSPQSKSSELMDHSLNFGAVVPSRENPLKYVLKGLFGGYPAGFTHQQFYRHTHIYVENELRDLWEYELNLNQEQVDQIVNHAWELLGARFVYYFAKQNCAYRMAELLQIVIADPLLPKFPWANPATAFDKLMAVKVDDAALVRKLKLIPSKQNTFIAQYKNLAITERNILKRLSKNVNNMSSDVQFQQCSTQNQIAIVDALANYTELRTLAGKKKDKATFKGHKRTLMLERLKLPRRENEIKLDYLTPPPHITPRPVMFRTMAIHNNVLGNGVEIQARPTFYDFLSRNTTIPYSLLSMLDARIVGINGKLKLRSFALTHVETMNITQTGFKYDGGLAWRFKLGWESHDNQCLDCLVGKMQGGLGKAWRVKNLAAVYFQADLFAQGEYADSDWLGAFPHLGIISRSFNLWRSHIDLGRHVYLVGDKEKSTMIRWENAFGSSRNWDLRINYYKGVTEEFQMGFSLYW